MDTGRYEKKKTESGIWTRYLWNKKSEVFPLDPFTLLNQNASDVNYNP